MSDPILDIRSYTRDEGIDVQFHIDGEYLLRSSSFDYFAQTPTGTKHPKLHNLIGKIGDNATDPEHDSVHAFVSTSNRGMPPNSSDLR